MTKPVAAPHAPTRADIPRALPRLTPANTFFWTAGRDHRLKFLRCQCCGLYLHPPSPLCRRCRSTAVQPEAVSGRGSLFSYTVNHYAWTAVEPLQPYIIALVELVEQPALRLTTNLVDCRPDDTQIGMPVEVTFEQHEDVWLPLFRPAGRHSR